jgi:hypothetical protein
MRMYSSLAGGVVLGVCIMRSIRGNNLKHTISDGIDGIDG